MISARASRTSWHWAAGAMLGSLLVLGILGVAAVRWEAQARAEEQRARAQKAADKFVEVMWENLRAGNVSEGHGADGESWLPEPAEESEIFQRYLDGEYEYVLGAGRGHRTPAGLPVQSLAALQLIRRETDPERLEELSNAAWSAGGFLVPILMREAEERHRELNIPFPSLLQDWQIRWDTKRVRVDLMSKLALEPEDLERGRWVRSGRGEWWLRAEPGGGGILALPVAGVLSAVRRTQQTVPTPQGTSTQVAVADKTMIEYATGTRTLVQAGDEIAVSIVVTDEKLLGKGDRVRGLVLAGATGVAVGAGILGLWLAYGAIRRERGFAERQGNFIAAVSHEMRTPLASMRLLADNLERDLLESPATKTEHARLIQQEMERLSRMVERVLSFSRYEAGSEPARSEEIDPRELFERAQAPVIPLAEERNVRIEILGEEFERWPRGERDLLVEAVVNLLDNAVKHSPEHGAVRVGARPQGQSWCLWVEDEGEGIPEIEREKVFEQFYRVGSELRREQIGSGWVWPS